MAHFDPHDLPGLTRLDELSLRSPDGRRKVTLSTAEALHPKPEPELPKSVREQEEERFARIGEKLAANEEPVTEDLEWLIQQVQEVVDRQKKKAKVEALLKVPYQEAIAPRVASSPGILRRRVQAPPRRRYEHRYKHKSRTGHFTRSGFQWSTE